jgi:hypothetical protein
MKTKFTLIVLLTASLAVGFVAGKFQASFPWRDHLASYTFRRDAYSADCYTQVLTLWRSGHEDDARSALDRYLDLSLASLQNVPASAVSGDMRGTILRAKEYRAKYPAGETAPELESRIQKVFSMVQ